MVCTVYKNDINHYFIGGDNREELSCPSNAALVATVADHSVS
jgi:hypothetical protein